jgi:hypothetical protein
MNRPLRELIKDFEGDPDRWEVVKIESAPSTNLRNRGGATIQELLRHKKTGEEMVRHTLRKADGALFSTPHFRPMWK